MGMIATTISAVIVYHNVGAVDNDEVAAILSVYAQVPGPGRICCNNHLSSKTESVLETHVPVD